MLTQLSPQQLRLRGLPGSTQGDDGPILAQQDAVWPICLGSRVGVASQLQAGTHGSETAGAAQREVLAHGAHRQSHVVRQWRTVLPAGQSSQLLGAQASLGVRFSLSLGSTAAHLKSLTYINICT